MVFKILDASAFYAGVPFRTSEDCYTTTIVYDEIKHIKKNHNALETLIETSRLKIKEPEKKFLEMAIDAAKNSGDFQQLSKEDLSIIALGIEVNGEIITDDFAISNVGKNLGLKISSIMTQGIKTVGKWVHYCPGCRVNLKSGNECPMCGSSLKRKLLKS